MRLIVCWMALLCGCSKPIVRCDAHLQPINAPAASGALGAAASGIPARRAP
jgi:hypothetical protein